MVAIQNKIESMNAVSRQMSKGIKLVLAVLLLSINFSFAQEDCNKEGEALFKTNCATCHHMTSQKSTGPGLEGVMERVPSKDWLRSWIKNNQALIQSGDAYANKVFNDNNQQAMSVFEWLSDEELDNIVAYVVAGKDACKEEGGSGATDDNPYGDEASWKTPGTYEEDSNWFTWLIVVSFLFVVISVFAGLNRQLKKVKAEREGKELPVDKGILDAILDWAQNNRKWASILGLVVTLFVGGYVLNGIYNIGVFGGATHPEGNVTGFKNVESNYKPSQPIDFPHDLHAGKNEIDCQYCHSASRKSKTAGIPSVNVCMNCHKGIQKGQRSGEVEVSAEIQKIYDAAGWDINKRMYNHGTESDPVWMNEPRTDNPIVWNKVHNLPDFVYFNHSQHVEVGKIECQTCHGPIQEMDQAEQWAPLTMKWCIECHRETEVNYEGNEYYDRIHEEAREAYKHLPIDEFKFTVEKIGGLECGKCHY